MGGVIRGQGDEDEDEPVQGMKANLERVMAGASREGADNPFEKVGVSLFDGDELRSVDDVFDDLLRVGDEMPVERQEKLAPTFFGEEYQPR